VWPLCAPLTPVINGFGPRLHFHNLQIFCQLAGTRAKLGYKLINNKCINIYYLLTTVIIQAEIFFKDEKGQNLYYICLKIFFFLAAMDTIFVILNFIKITFRGGIFLPIQKSMNQIN
jgi:hypothetical protein